MSSNSAAWLSCILLRLEDREWELCFLLALYGLLTSSRWPAWFSSFVEGRGERCRPFSELITDVLCDPTDSARPMPGLMRPVMLDIEFMKSLEPTSRLAEYVSLSSRDNSTVVRDPSFPFRLL
ncbi:hypothetical protein ABW21_db0206788 [Orbilia brochopaga]|nr:hypothetical protein ABW21_db0206788 [Drechslerella brochopaga]